MKPCCFSTIMNTLLKYMTISNSGKQMTLMNAVLPSIQKRMGKRILSLTREMSANGSAAKIGRHLRL